MQTESLLIDFLWLCSFIWWLAASAFVAHTASRNGQGGGMWFAAAFFLSPPFAAILLAGAMARGSAAR
jgi:hypothetical protein